jgi:hypothetical protein
VGVPDLERKMAVDLPRSVKRHARKLAVIVRLIHQDAASQSQAAEYFAAYFGEVCSGFAAIGAREDEALELAFAAVSRMLDVIASRSEARGPV